MAEEIAREGEQVLEGRLPDGQEALHRVLVDRAVAVDADRAPRHVVAAHVEVGREVEPVGDARRGEAVELVDVPRVEVRRRAVRPLRDLHVVVVEADRVVAHAGERPRELRLVRARRVRAVADVHAPEALRDARQVLELEVRPAPHDAAVLPGRRVDADRLREVERRAGLRPGEVLHGDPVRARGAHPVRARDHDAVRSERDLAGERIRRPAREGLERPRPARTATRRPTRSTSGCPARTPSSSPDGRCGRGARRTRRRPRRTPSRASTGGSATPAARRGTRCRSWSRRRTSRPRTRRRRA